VLTSFRVWEKACPRVTIPSFSSKGHAQTSLGDRDLCGDRHCIISFLFRTPLPIPACDFLWIPV
jgi:hypothetical protein